MKATKNASYSLGVGLQIEKLTRNISGIMFCVFIFISSLVKDHYWPLLGNFTRLGDTAGVWREFSGNFIIKVCMRR